MAAALEQQAGASRNSIQQQKAAAAGRPDRSSKATNKQAIIAAI